MIQPCFLEIKATTYSEYLETKRAKIKEFLLVFDDKRVEGVGVGELISTLATLPFEAVNVFCWDLEFVSMFILYFLEENGLEQTDKLEIRGEYEFFQTYSGAVYGLSFIAGNVKVFFRSFDSLIPLKKEPNAVEMQRAYFEVANQNYFATRSSTAGASAYKMWLMGYYGKFTKNENLFRAMYKNCVSRIAKKLPKIEYFSDESSIIRHSLTGGLDYIKKGFIEEEGFRGVIYDCNGLYSFIMKKFPLPVGKPRFVETPDLSKLQILHVFIKGGKLKKGHPPFVWKRFRTGDERFMEEVEFGAYSVWNFEFALIQECYEDLEFEFLNILEFDSEMGLFNKFINAVVPYKSSEKESVKAFGKQMLNSLAGKFATKEMGVNRICDGIGEDGLLKFSVNVEWKTVPEHYRALTSCIYARARCFMVEAISKNFNRCIYCSTDSLFLVGNPSTQPVGVEIDDKKLGAFKRVSAFKNMRLYRTRAYLFEDYEGNLGTSISGLSLECQARLTFDNAKCGTTLKNGNLKTELAVGGAVKKPQDFKL